MKISELIKKLAEMQKKYGDLRVIKSSGIWNDDIEDITYEDDVMDEETDKRTDPVILIQ
jgi:hypothetical protein